MASSTTTPEEYASKAAEAYRQRVLADIREHGTPKTDPAEAGVRAAVLTTAGQAWNDEVGPFYDTHGARIALGGVTKQAISDRVSKGRLLALRLAGDGTGRERLVYPAWQFRPAVLRSLATVLETAGYHPGRPVTGWTIASWLTTPEPELGATPLELLEAGHLNPLLAAAAEVRATLGVDERLAVRDDVARTA